MAAMSNAVRRTGRTTCDLCGKKGTERSPLSRHHVDGNPRNNDPYNHMVLHRILCHSFADYITQLFLSKGETASADKIQKAWQLINASDWLFKLVYF